MPLDNVTQLVTGAETSTSTPGFRGTVEAQSNPSKMGLRPCSRASWPLYDGCTGCTVPATTLQVSLKSLVYALRVMRPKLVAVGQAQQACCETLQPLSASASS